jgi:hypothetical protein
MKLEIVPILIFVLSQSVYFCDGCYLLISGEEFYCCPNDNKWNIQDFCRDIDKKHYCSIYSCPTNSMRMTFRTTTISTTTRVSSTIMRWETGLFKKQSYEFKTKK